MDFYWPFYKRILYLLLPMHILWKILDNKSKDLIRSANMFHNNTRKDYSGKQIYGEFREEGGLIWENFKIEKIKSDFFISFLKNNFDFSNSKDLSILEIGPGGGFYTRYIIENLKVTDYIAIEVSDFFADQLRRNLKNESTKSQILQGDALEEIRKLEKNKFDLIIFLSSFHHLADRDEIFKQLERILKKNGSIIMKEPTHYIPRIYELIRKILFQKDEFGRSYLDKLHFCKKQFVATHHFISFEELKNYIKLTGGLVIKKINYKYGRKKIFKLLLGKYASNELITKIVKF